MINFNKINCIEQLSNYLNDLSVCDIPWNGKRKFYHSFDDKKLSMNEIIQKLYDLYSEKYFIGCYVKENDIKLLNKIIKNIKNLDNESDEKLNNCSILKKINHWIASFFGIRITSNKHKLFNFIHAVNKNIFLDGIKTSNAKVREKFFLNSVIKTDLHPLVKEAFDASYRDYYSQEFKDHEYRPREAKWEVNGQVIQRYNHGLPHAVRKAFFIPFIVDYFERQGLDHLVKQLQLLFEREGKENAIAKLQIVMAYEVAGRDSECGSRDDLKTYTRYLSQSQYAFRQYCMDANLVGENKLFKDADDVEYYVNAIKNKYPNRFLGEEMDVVTAIVDASHTLDEFRCYWPSRMKQEIDSLNAYTKNKNNIDLWNLSKFCQQAVKITGDRLMTEFVDSDSQGRNLEFKNGDLKSFLYDNFCLTNAETFLKCSKETAHCWDILKAVPQPIPYSRGETTYSYLKRHLEQVNNRDVETHVNPNKFEELKEIISHTRAAIRLVDSKKDHFQFEMNMIQDPVFFRPVRQSPTDRDYVLVSRAEGIIAHRSYKKRISLMQQQEAIHSNTTPIWGPVHKAKDRGKPQLSKFTKKLSLSLLRKDGKTHHFKGQWPQDYYGYEPIGMLYDVDQLHQKNNKFIFDYDVATSSKFWVGQEAASEVGKKIGRESNLTLIDLQNELNQEVEEGKEPEALDFIKMQHASNEMLMGVTKSALKALFAANDDPTDRVRVFLHAIYLTQDYGINVPVLIIDGNTPPRVYSQTCLMQDLEDLSTSLNPIKHKLFQELLLCFYSQTEIGGLKDQPQALYKKCTELFKVDRMPSNLFYL